MRVNSTSLMGSGGIAWIPSISPSSSAPSEGEGCPITIKLNWVSSSFWNKSSMEPFARNLSRSHGKRSPARGALSGRPFRVFDKELFR